MFGIPLGGSRFSSWSGPKFREVQGVGEPIMRDSQWSNVIWVKYINNKSSLLGNESGVSV